jgi:hypothetical protein
MRIEDLHSVSCLTAADIRALRQACRIYACLSLPLRPLPLQACFGAAICSMTAPPWLAAWRHSCPGQRLGSCACMCLPGVSLAGFNRTAAAAAAATRAPLADAHTGHEAYAHGRWWTCVAGTVLTLLHCNAQAAAGAPARGNGDAPWAPCHWEDHHHAGQGAAG